MLEESLETLREKSQKEISFALLYTLLTKRHSTIHEIAESAGVKEIEVLNWINGEPIPKDKVLLLGSKLNPTYQEFINLLSIRKSFDLNDLSADSVRENIEIHKLQEEIETTWIEISSFIEKSHNEAFEYFRDQAHKNLILGALSGKKEISFLIIPPSQENEKKFINLNPEFTDQSDLYTFMCKKLSNYLNESGIHYYHLNAEEYITHQQLRLEEQVNNFQQSLGSLKNLEDWESEYTDNLRERKNIEEKIREIECLTPDSLPQYFFNSKDISELNLSEHQIKKLNCINCSYENLEEPRYFIDDTESPDVIDLTDEKTIFNQYLLRWLDDYMGQDFVKFIFDEVIEKSLSQSEAKFNFYSFDILPTILKLYIEKLRPKHKEEINYVKKELESLISEVESKKHFQYKSIKKIITMIDDLLIKHVHTFVNFRSRSEVLEKIYANTALVLADLEKDIPNFSLLLDAPFGPWLDYVLFPISYGHEKKLMNMIIKGEQIELIFTSVGYKSQILADKKYPGLSILSISL
jgi:transcriptional regulator with XRE-family HTH domain